jgi:hypothetical protein
MTTNLEGALFFPFSTTLEQYCSFSSNYARGSAKKKTTATITTSEHLNTIIIH